MNQEQEIIFKEAFLVSNFLILWYTPNRKELLTTEQKKELEERLWKKNTLDALVVEKLGEEAWYKPPNERIQLKSEDYQRISQLTQETKDFIRQLERGTEWEGQIDKEIIANRHKTIRQWIEENAQE
ncbi:protein of unknown function [endosymbiont DhMRE of Dentiscutata heterogama]|uniref:hypothetical protein n=1 Tax=endosymbiont DhMRE of Dentiscutata heterogama TaxID=1609546 RepID=UPI000629D83D|nr:hypothetical protein [endosymbiont DhMRE of Dentiscutata heterogama]CFW93276.1 protein of unknown function [endosymbiont DhMRE of Dentiscutata heterogama]